jgi:hypothetical protein
MTPRRPLDDNREARWMTPRSPPAASLSEKLPPAQRPSEAHCFMVRMFRSTSGFPFPT